MGVSLDLESVSSVCRWVAGTVCKVIRVCNPIGESPIHRRLQIRFADLARWVIARLIATMGRTPPEGSETRAYRSAVGWVQIRIVA